jgi:molybdate transport system substrate-binding protein
MRWRTTLLAELLALWLGVSGAQAAEFTVLSAGAMKTIVIELAEEFRRQTGHTMKATFSPVGVQRKKLEAGERADVVILSDTVIDQLAGQGLVRAGSRTDLARTGMGVCVRQGAPLPDISTAEAFKQSLLAAKSIVYVDPAQGATSGVHFAGVLQRLGIAEAVKSKTVLVPGGFAADVVAKGEAEMCVHQISEIVPVAGATLVGPLPRDLQKVTTYSAGLPASAEVPDVARAFIAFLTRPESKARLAAAGLDYRE